MSAIATQDAPSPVERYRAAFDARWRGDDALTALRRTAIEQFVSLGFPTQRHEDWKYTNLRRLETRNFLPADKSSLNNVLAVDSKQDEWIKDAGARIVLVNGHWTPSLSARSAYPPGVTVLSLGQWAEHDAGEVAKFLSPARSAESSALEHLNAAFFEDGVVVKLADGAVMDEPLYIVHQWNEHAAQRMSHPRLIVQAGRNSRCIIVEQFLGPSTAEYFTNSVATIDVAAGAAVSHYRLQQESLKSFHIGHINVRQQSDSRYACHDIALGSSLGRVGISTMLEGSGSHAALHGLFVPMGTQHLDSHTRIEHVAPLTTSEEDYRGVAAARGRGVFNGKVIVRPGAQKIDARQSSRNLLLSPTAEIDTKPELEIYANDVKCSHGATTGQLDTSSLFYLRSRGLSEADARALLIRAFAQSILKSVEHAPVRSYIEQQLDRRFALPKEVQS